MMADQYEEMPAAGKATTAGAGSAGLPAGNYADMQNTLSSLMIQKQNVSNKVLLAIERQTYFYLT